MTTLVAPNPEAGSKPAQILEAAGLLFMEHGYGAVSMDAVAKKANVSKATLYAHFGSKEELFRAMVACECASSVLAGIWDEATRLPVAEGLRLIGRTFVKFVASPKALSVYRMVLGEVLRFPELAQAFYDSGPAETFIRGREFLAEAAAKGELAIEDADLATHQFFGLLKANMHMKLLLCLSERPSDAELERFVDAAVDLFVKGYAPGAR
ncbi:TetR/AcrR family transcriptional regulator [Azospirillum picis]|uniref:AcrR family transcriptional regulator n=1 Tax=Azospirillum picis TaxID=488438 RepID=A0ABU0MH08_9PROT|nr:TetR/AcrR family transcriptional regulator [Azospirillum picis]MBP2299035.1 AcrR family transcriptional regulator [Azospirillum picis]MDQ0532723.1 AcrR family transcriptional regulator [Azospirillum picis]